MSVELLFKKAREVVDFALTKYENGRPVQQSEETTKRINHFMDELKEILVKKLNDSASGEFAFSQKIMNACRALEPETVKRKVPCLDKWVPSSISASMSDASIEEYARDKMDYVRKVFNEL